VSPLAAPQGLGDTEKEVEHSLRRSRRWIQIHRSKKSESPLAKTNAVGGCERSVTPLPLIKLLPSAVSVHLRNLRPMLVQHLRISLPLQQPIPDEHPSDSSPNLTDV